MFQLDLHRLSVFYTVVNEGTLSKAGERLYMSQPAISAHLKALEQQLGVPLFYRVGRRSMVNRAGEILYKKAGELFTVADELIAEMENLKGVSSGRLSLGASVGWQYRLPRALDQFKQIFPGIELSLEIANSDRIEKMVADRALDIGFITRAGLRPELTSEQLAEDEVVVICSPRHRLAGSADVGIEEIADESLLLREAGSAVRHAIEEELARANLSKNVSMELGSYEAIKGAVMAGKGLGIAPREAVRAELEAGMLAIVGVPLLRRSIELHMVYLTQKKLTVAQKAFVEMVTTSKTLSGPVTETAVSARSSGRANGYPQDVAGG